MSVAHQLAQFRAQLEDIRKTVEAITPAQAGDSAASRDYAFVLLANLDREMQRAWVDELASERPVSGG